jgi:hypothetical protein
MMGKRGGRNEIVKTFNKKVLEKGAKSMIVCMNGIWYEITEIEEGLLKWFKIPGQIQNTKASG